MVESSSVIVTVVVFPTLLVVIEAIPLPSVQSVPSVQGVQGVQGSQASHLAHLNFEYNPYLILSASAESDNNILSSSAGVVFSMKSVGKMFVIY